MALFLPPAVTINKFKGGFKSTPDFSDLNDTETNNSRNVVYNPNSDIEKRKGSLRLLNTRLASTGVTAGAVVTGHYHFAKLGSSQTFHVVAAGDSLFNYSSATASAIRTGLSGASNSFWNYVQIQDPRSASDDIVVMSNGVDPIQVWNGSATTINLSSFTSATSVPIAKYLLQHRNRIYAANITDTAEVDAAVKVFRSEFGTDGVPNPHRFTQFFYIGGSSKDGAIQGQKTLNDDIIYYTEKSIWKFTPGLGDVNDLQRIVENTGLLAPFSLADVGGIHIFLSERGVMTFDGNNITSLSSKVVDDFLLDDTNLSVLKFSKAIYDVELNQYKLYIPKSGSNRNNIGLIYDFRTLIWQPPIEGREVSFLSSFFDSNDKTKIIFGDYRGYLYEDDRGNSEGLASGYNDTAAAATANTLTASSATFSTANNGLSGFLLKIVSGAGEGQERYITTNTSSVLTLESDFSIIPNSASKYTVGGINSYWRSKDYDFGGADISKLFKSINTRLREEGNFNLKLHYFIDFHKIGRAGLKNISLLESAMIWGLSKWGEASWGREDVISPKTKLTSINNQSIIGRHIAFRFSNQYADQPWRINGFDVEFKAIGKR